MDRARAVLPASHARFGLLDSLRALAAIAILLVHATILSGDVRWWHGILAHLDIGVPFFFVLSAFLLYRPFVASRRGLGPRRSFATYGRRRFARVMPAYWVALTVSAVVPGLYGAFTGNWWVYYGLLQNYPIYTAEGTCAVDPFRCGIPTSWSLAVEIGFYAMLPLFVLLTDRIARGPSRRKWIAGEGAAIGALALVSVWIQSRRPSSDLDRWLFFSPFGRGWWFGLGLALAVASVWLEERGGETGWSRALRRRPGAFVGAAAAAYVLASVLLLEPGPSLNYPLGDLGEYVAEYLLFGVIALFVIAPATIGQEGGGLVRRALAHPALTWLGLVSYGIFLWQFPVMIGLVDAGFTLDFVPFTAAALIGTVACAAASWYLVERPFMRWTHRRRGARGEVVRGARAGARVG